MKTINLTVQFPHDRQLNNFINMLAWMELCGNVGHSTDFVVTMDGDGSARPKFDFHDDDLNKGFDDLRNQYIQELKSCPSVKDVGPVDMLFNIS